MAVCNNFICRWHFDKTIPMPRTLSSEQHQAEQRSHGITRVNGTFSQLRSACETLLGQFFFFFSHFSYYSSRWHSRHCHIDWKHSMVARAVIEQRRELISIGHGGLKNYYGLNGWDHSMSSYLLPDRWRTGERGLFWREIQLVWSQLVEWPLSRFKLEDLTGR